MYSIVENFKFCSTTPIKLQKELHFTKHSSALNLDPAFDKFSSGLMLISGSNFRQSQLYRVLGEITGCGECRGP